jgi:hypothetical protein
MIRKSLKKNSPARKKEKNKRLMKKKTKVQVKELEKIKRNVATMKKNFLKLLKRRSIN